MNIFRSDSAPYVLALIVSALGWYFAQLTEELRSSRTAIYTVSHSSLNRTAEVTFENLSRSEAMRGLIVHAACDGDSRVDPSVRNRSRTIVYPPHRPLEDTGLESTARQESYRIGIAPGGAIGVNFSLPNCQSTITLSFNQESDPQFYLIPSRSIEGFVASNYAVVLVIGFVVFASILAIWIMISLYFLWRRRKHEDDKGSDPQRLDVSLTLVD